MSKYRVIRTETISYVKEYTEDELVNLGFPREVFTDGDLVGDFGYTLQTERDALDALTEDTERYGDVQGNDFRIEQVRS